MNQLLKEKQILPIDGNNSCLVEKFLGSGGQGEVYRVSIQGSPYALKWYYPKQATPEQKDGLDNLIRIGAPNDKFLWPKFLLTNPKNNTYGYIMPLRSQQYKGINDLMRRRVEPTFKALISAGVQLANSFAKLHAKGLCYRDISFGNLFFDPVTGDIQICDNDNVTTNGNPVVTVLGTPRFTAPEIVRAEAYPSRDTDLFSLAVLLHYMLFVHHPLEGEQEAKIHAFDLPAMTRLYGRNPIYIYDPKNTTNRPVPGLHDNAIAFWKMYPTFIKNLFIRAFTDGLKPNNRVMEIEWRDNLARLHDSLIYCRCGAENFHDASEFEKTGNTSKCWSCQKTINLPPRLKIGRNLVMINVDTFIYPFHINPAIGCEFINPVAKVNQHPQNKNLWGFQNLSKQKWTVISNEGAITEVLPGKNVSLINGIRINFGKTEGEIQV
jgi:DNA-binding helix-hairpin-helix protein with protein kinase domain